MRKLVTRPQAQLDVEEAATWYETQNLASAFDSWMNLIM